MPAGLLLVAEVTMRFPWMLRVLSLPLLIELPRIYTPSVGGNSRKLYSWILWTEVLNASEILWDAEYVYLKLLRIPTKMNVDYWKQHHSILSYQEYRTNYTFKRKLFILVSLLCLFYELSFTGRVHFELGYLRL